MENIDKVLNVKEHNLESVFTELEKEKSTI